jgi:2-keto-4-pentenoate hydratase/2-oxohepta-3-ene-1,7-dioic acid hydratase in catechol pathway
MKIARIRYGEGSVSYASVVDEGYFLIEGSVFDADNWQVTTVLIPFEEAELLAPVRPPHLYAIGLNYAAHVDEFKNIDPTRANPKAPICFLCASTAVAAPGQAITIARPDHNTDYEAELVIVMGKRATNVTADQALDYVLGYTCGNDVSDRNYQNQDKQWLRAKSLPTYKPMGPWIATDIRDPQKLAVKSFLNGAPRQDGNTCDMLFSCAQLIAHISSFTTLYPGDVIYSGTPVGVGHLKAGDEITVEIEGIGTLTNPVQ